MCLVCGIEDDKIVCRDCHESIKLLPNKIDYNKMFKKEFQERYR